MKSHRTIILFLLISFTLNAQVINLEGKWKFSIGDDQSWASPEFNDNNWQTIRVPSAWEDEGYNGYDGFGWYRVKFDGRKLEKNGLYYVNLGFIDDADEAYLNGMFIGFSGKCPPNFKTAYNNERQYAMPSGIINFTGENTLAIRVYDVVHQGGIVHGNIGIYEVYNNRRLLIDLQGIWSFAKSKWGERVPDREAWSNIMVPALWESQGLSRYDGYGWYRRTFTVPADFTTTELVLMLGKIDDFDEVYINGRKIGETNDHRPYGASKSYITQRVYNIPPGLLKRNSTNTIDVLTEDIGGMGGIYEGPVGITSRSNYERYFKE